MQLVLSVSQERTYSLYNIYSMIELINISLSNKVIAHGIKLISLFGKKFITNVSFRVSITCAPYTIFIFNILRFCSTQMAPILYYTVLTEAYSDNGENVMSRSFDTS